MSNKQPQSSRPLKRSTRCGVPHASTNSLIDQHEKCFARYGDYVEK